MTGTEKLITYRATLWMPAAQAHPEETGRRMRAEIDGLRRSQRQARAAKRQSDTEGGTLRAAFRRSGGSDRPVYELKVTGICPDNVLAELARLTLTLVLRHPVTHVGWLSDAARLDRATFLTALAPPPPRLTRPERRAEITTPRPVRGSKRRLSGAEAQRVQENVIRLEVCRPVSPAEKAEIRRDLGLPGPERRIASATLALTGAALALNATGAAASMLSATGLG